jgi:hypothetical protein
MHKWNADRKFSIQVLRFSWQWLSWVVIPYCLVGEYQHFRGTRCSFSTSFLATFILHTSTMKMEAGCSSESIYKNTRCHRPKDNNIFNVWHFKNYNFNKEFIFSSSECVNFNALNSIRGRKYSREHFTIVCWETCWQISVLRVQSNIKVFIVK